MDSDRGTKRFMRCYIHPPPLMLTDALHDCQPQAKASDVGRAETPFPNSIQKLRRYATAGINDHEPLGFESDGDPPTLSMPQGITDQIV